jgi:hypothetical protein
MIDKISILFIESFCTYLDLLFYILKRNLFDENIIKLIKIALTLTDKHFIKLYFKNKTIYI